MSVQTLQKTLEAYKIFKRFPKYVETVSEAIEYCYNGEYGKADEMINKLPTVKNMLSELVEKLKGKSIYTGLKDLMEGKLEDTLSTLTVLSSLQTHCIIEAKKNPEYILLLEEVERKYNSLREKLNG